MTPSFLPLAAAAASEEVVAWIKVDHPKLDLVGLILGAFSLTGVLALAAMALGAALGVALIYKRRADTSLHPPLDLHGR